MVMRRGQRHSTSKWWGKLCDKCDRVLGSTETQVQRWAKQWHLEHVSNKHVSSYTCRVGTNGRMISIKWSEEIQTLSTEDLQLEDGRLPSVSICSNTARPTESTHPPFQPEEFSPTPRPCRMSFHSSRIYDMTVLSPFSAPLILGSTMNSLFTRPVQAGKITLSDSPSRDGSLRQITMSVKRMLFPPLTSPSCFFACPSSPLSWGGNR
ncbi:hypothetical protein HD554DRAFT_246747 [Boletus coccyginus]|nr:hypothetical protein HD554DRAFT_218462 [Boletus coccyginus]KAI9571083.1 hypothetical protein HD554DRAFT_246747 [Boletus coccyginus]